MPTIVPTQALRVKVNIKAITIIKRAKPNKIFSIIDVSLCQNSGKVIKIEYVKNHAIEKQPLKGPVILKVAPEVRNNAKFILLK